MTTIKRPLRPLFWAGSSKRDYRKFPARIQSYPGFELFLAQTGQHPPSAKPLKRFGSGILELVADFSGDTFRAVYAVRFEMPCTLFMRSKRSRNEGPRPRKAKSTLCGSV